MQRLVNLNTKEYEHPFDRAALATVKATPVLPQVTQFILNWTVVQHSIISLCGCDYHVTKSACPPLYQLATEALNTLDLDHMPEIYVQQDYNIKGYTTGHDNTAYIVLSSGAVDRLSDAELSFIVGHEGGHIKSGHILYHLLSAYIASAAAFIPTLGPMAMKPLIDGLYYWNRMSDYTADRAGLLACQDLNVALSAIMKSAGLPMRYYGEASLEGFIEQAKEFEHKYDGPGDKMIKTLAIIESDHPWNVARAAELIKWVESGEYDRILRNCKGKKCAVCGYDCASDAEACPRCGSKIFVE